MGGIRNVNMAFGHKNRTTKAFGLPNTATANLPASVAGQGTTGTTGMLLYDSTSGTLKYNNGSGWNELSTGGGTSHAVLSSTHSDTLAGTVIRGDVLYGNSTPKWARLAVGTTGQVLQTNGTDVSWGAIAVGSITLATGSIIIGASAVGAALDIKGDGKIVVGNGTTATSVSVSGNCTLANTGAMTVTGLTIPSEAQGDIIYRGASAWVRLGAGTSGMFLQTQGAAANPQWANPSALTAGGLNSPFTIEGGTYDPSTTVTAQTTSAAALTIPDLGGTAQQWVFSIKAQTLENKTVKDATFYIVDDADTTKVLQFQCSGITTGTTRTVTLPDASGPMTLLGNTSTGSGSVVLATSPALVTPTLGVATVTSVNKVTITAPATSAVLTVADGKTLTCSNTLTFSGTDTVAVAFGANNITLTTSGATGVTLPTTGTLATLAGTETFTNKTLTTPTLTTPTTNGVKYAYAEKSGAYTMVATDYMVLVDTTAGNVTITLPTAVGIAGTVYVIKKKVAGNTLTIDGNGAETIDGSATVSLTTQYDYRMIMSEGANWMIISA